MNTDQTHLQAYPTDAGQNQIHALTDHSPHPLRSPNWHGLISKTSHFLKILRQFLTLFDLNQGLNRPKKHRLMGDHQVYLWVFK